MDKHEKTFFNYGTNHQECLAHILRYLKDSIDNEPDLVWNREVQTFLRELIHKRKQVQAMSFRSQGSIDYLCQCMSMLVMMRKTEEENIFEKVSTTLG